MTATLLFAGNIAIQHTHRIVDLHEAATDQKLKFREMNTKLKEKMRMVELGVHNVEHRSMEVQEQVDYLKKDVTEKMDNLVSIIRAHQEEMIQSLENIRRDKLENLTFHLKLFESMMSQTESSFNFIEDLLQRNISEEIMHVKNHVTSRVEEITSLEVGTNPAENEQVGYVPNAEIFDGLQNSRLGKVVTSLTEPSMSTAEGDGVDDVSAGEEAEFTVTTRNAHVVVEVKSSMWGIIESSVRNYKNGTYEVSYIPRVPGPYRVQIEVAGHLIKGQPLHGRSQATDPITVEVLWISWQCGWKIHSTTRSGWIKHWTNCRLRQFKASHPRVHGGRRPDPRLRRRRNKGWQIVPPHVHSPRQEPKVHTCNKH